MSAPYSSKMSSGADRVLQALAHLAELARDRLAVEEERAVALHHLGGLDVHAALVGVRRGEDHALVHEPLERLDRRHVAEVVQHLVPEARVEEVQHRVLDAADVEVDEPGLRRAVERACPAPTPARPRDRRAGPRWSGRGSAGSTNTIPPTAASCWSRGGTRAARRRNPPTRAREVELDLDPVGGARRAAAAGNASGSSEVAGSKSVISGSTTGSSDSGSAIGPTSS